MCFKSSDLMNKHVKPFREFLGLTQEEMAELLDKESRTSVSNWETAPNQEEHLPSKVASILFTLMKDAGYKPERLGMPLNSYKENLGALSKDYEDLEHYLNSLINFQDEAGQYEENHIDRVALIRINLRPAKTAICLATTAASKSREISDADLEYVVDDIFSEEVLKFDDLEPPIKSEARDILYIKRALDNTSFAFVFICKGIKDEAPFYSYYETVQPKIASMIRKIMRDRGLL